MASKSPPASSPASSPAKVPVANIEHDNSPLEDFVEKHKAKLLICLLAAPLIIVGFLAFNYFKGAAASEAAAALTGATAVEELRDVVRNYPKSVVAGSAELLMAEKLKEEGKADEGYALLKNFVERRKGHPLYNKGLSDLGVKEHVRGDLEAAVTLLRRATAPGAGPDVIKQIALLRLGDALTAQGLEAMARDDVERAKTLFAEAQIAFQDCQALAGEETKHARTAKERKERLPHLSIPPLPAKEAAEVAPADDSTVPEASTLDPSGPTAPEGAPEPATADPHAGDPVPLPQAGDAPAAEDTEGAPEPN